MGTLKHYLYINGASTFAVDRHFVGRTLDNGKKYLDTVDSFFITDYDTDSYINVSKERFVEELQKFEWCKNHWNNKLVNDYKHLCNIVGV